MAVGLETSALLIFLFSVVGGILPLQLSHEREEFLKVFVCLGAGLLLGMAFLHMIPESSELLPRSFGIWLMLGFLLLLVLERFLLVHPCEEHGCHYHTVGITAFIGLTVHGIIEGMGLASSMLVTQSGWLVLFAILAHKAPAGFALASMLKLAGRSRKSILVYIIGVALSAPLGILIAYTLIKNQNMPASAGALLGLSSGTFLYIGACDLLPELHREDKEKMVRLAAFLVGVVLSALSGLLVPH